jgi:hypothetical protein
MTFPFLTLRDPFGKKMAVEFLKWAVEKKIGCSGSGKIFFLNPYNFFNFTCKIKVFL